MGVRRGEEHALDLLAPDIDQLVTNMGFHENLDVICAGIQPPNPTEMLLSNRLEKSLIRLR